MRRPTASESKRSWEDIWYATMDCKLRQAVSASSGDCDFDPVAEAKRKVPRSLHQNTSGHGYRQADNVFLHPGCRYRPDGTDLGASPAETVGIHRARAMKQVFG